MALSTLTLVRTLTSTATGWGYLIEVVAGFARGSMLLMFVAACAVILIAAVVYSFLYD